MNKLLLGSAAIAGLVLASAPAQAQMELTIGGHSKNYVGYLSQDTTPATDERNIDMVRETELHFNGESTLDNGLTFGFQVETEVDGGDASRVEESYIYLSGTWGRINAGSENGAAYLLQVSAPSADSNIDGIRQYINATNYAIAPINAFTTGTGSWAGGTPAGTGDVDGFDYDNDLTGTAEKLTYLSPNWNGFQVGASYTFDTADNNSSAPVGTGFNTDNNGAATGDAWEVAGRYEGVVSNFGYAIGAGYTVLNNDLAATDNTTEWNVGLDVDSGPFGVGVIYTEGDDGSATRENVDTWVAGVDYTTGPFKFGASYFTQDDETTAATDLETDRWTGGVIYTAGPGLSFRGSISNIQHDLGATSADSTSVLGGVQINF